MATIGFTEQKVIERDIIKVELRNENVEKFL